MTLAEKSMRYMFLACMFATLALAASADASSANYTLRAAGKDASTDTFLNATITVNGTAIVGTPWADFLVPSNADINATFNNSGYYTDSDIYFFDSELPACTTTPSCTIENNGYVTTCTNISTSSANKYSCDVQKNSIVFYFVFYPDQNGVLATNSLSAASNTPPEITGMGANVTVGQKPLEVRFTPTIVFHDGATVKAIEWSFGDNSSISNEYNVTHTFSEIGNYTVQLTVFDTNDLIDREWVNITVTRAPPTATFSASPTTTSPGQTVVLTWNTTDADSISIDQGIGAVNASGTTTVSPTTTTTYTLTASNSGGSTIRPVTVTVSGGSGSTPPAGGGDGGTSGGGGGVGGSSSGSVSSSSGGGSGRGRSGPPDVVVFPAKAVTTGGSASDTSPVSVIAIDIPELHVNELAMIAVKVTSARPVNADIALSVDGENLGTVNTVVDGEQDVVFSYLPMSEGDKEFTVTISSAEGTGNWKTTATVHPAVIQQNITGWSFAKLMNPVIIAAILSLAAIGVVIWKRDDLRKYFNI